MDAGLNERVLTLVVESGLTDSDQRSALGMARSWLATGRAIKRQTYFVGLFRRRDDLAEALVGEMVEADRGDCGIALAAAQEFVNAPFIDLTMNGQRFGRRELLKPGKAAEGSDA